MSKINKIDAMEILDSRGNPTVKAWVRLDDGSQGVAAVPSGASTGKREALELRDKEMTRYNGKGVLKAVENIRRIIGPKILGLEGSDQKRLDEQLINLDGTPNKAKLGANAILAVSLAVARASATSAKQPLFQYLAHLSGTEKYNHIPIPMCNILNGGMHATNTIDFQEFMIVPIGASSFNEGIRWCTDVFHTLKMILSNKGLSTGVGDEGGFAPNLPTNTDAIEQILYAIEKAGYKTGTQFKISIDSASSSFYHKDGQYNPTYVFKELTKDRKPIIKSSEEMIRMVEDWMKKYPILSWEDPLEEDDWDGFAQLTASIGKNQLIVGDDLFVTNPALIEKGIERKSANAVLIKLNQIGTLTETLDAINLCKNAGWRFIISHRSGETADSFIADLAVGTGSGLIKAGSLSRSDRLEKYNRLLEIELMLKGKEKYGL